MDEPKQQDKKDKKHRKRMKAVYSQIREQMEFYFSDSNLHKDRFLKQQLEQSKDGYIDLSLFLKFNRIRVITTDIDVISKALALSTTLKVSEDGQKVTRSKPISEPQNIDQRTVYVECLPHNVDHEWIKRLFATCGKVVYVSLPRYKSTKDTKGFAFVEFETIDGAKKACEELNNPPVEAEERPGRFPKTSKTLLYWQKRAGESQEQEKGKVEETNQTDEKERATESPTKSSKKVRKNKRPASDSSADGTTSDTSPIKRHKSSSKDCSDADVNKGIVESAELSVSDAHKSEEDDSAPRKKCKKRKSKSDQLSSENEMSESNSSIQGNVKDSKKRKASNRDSFENFEPPQKIAKDEKKNDKSKETDNVDVKEAEKKKNKRKRKKKCKEKDVPELRVISKQQWIQLRNEYLQLQKKSMIELKKRLVVSDSKSSNQNEENKSEEYKSSRPKIEFIPDVVVKVKSSEALTRKQLKEDIGSDLHIAYVDVKDGQMQGHIRFCDSDSARKMIESTVGCYLFSLIQGDEEKSYWDKLQSDREAKYQNTKNKNKKRGSQKLIDKAQKINKENVERKHIVFDD